MEGSPHLDFSDIRQFHPGTHPGMLLVRLREPGANALLECISAAMQAHPLESWAGCFVVLTEHKAPHQTVFKAGNIGMTKKQNLELEATGVAFR